MKKKLLSFLIFVLPCYACSDKPVTEGDILEYANDFTKKLSEQNITDSSFLQTFGVNTSEELRNLRAASIVPAVFCNLAQIKEMSLAKFDSVLDSSACNKYLVVYAIGESPVSEWFFRKNDTVKSDSSVPNNLFSKPKKIAPVLGERCESVIYPDCPKEVHLQIGNEKIVITYGNHVLLLIHDGQLFHRFYVINYKSDKYIVVLKNSLGEPLKTLEGLRISDFHDRVTGKSDGNNKLPKTYSISR